MKEPSGITTSEMGRSGRTNEKKKGRGEENEGLRMKLEGERGWDDGNRPFGMEKRGSDVAPRFGRDNNGGAFPRQSRRPSIRSRSPSTDSTDSIRFHTVPSDSRNVRPIPVDSTPHVGRSHIALPSASPRSRRPPMLSTPRSSGPARSVLRPLSMASPTTVSSFITAIVFFFCLLLPLCRHPRSGRSSDHPVRGGILCDGIRYINGCIVYRDIDTTSTVTTLRHDCICMVS